MLLEQQQHGLLKCKCVDVLMEGDVHWMESLILQQQHLLSLNASVLKVNLFLHVCWQDACTDRRHCHMHTQLTVVGSVRKTPMVAPRSSALKEWSVLMCQPLVWEQSVEPVLLDIVEMEKSALVSWDVHITCGKKHTDLLFHTLLSDINECLLDSSLCDHNCTNTVGSYDCVCDEGYEPVFGSGKCKGKWM